MQVQDPPMVEQAPTTTTTVSTGAQFLEAIKNVIHEGNVRRIVVKQGDHVIAEFPLTVGVVGTAFAPAVAALGAIVALVTDCTIVVERE